MPDDAEWDSLATPPRRGWRRVRIVASALALVGVGLVVTVFLGDRFGANDSLIGAKAQSYTDGRDIWLKNCAACHGISGEGTTAERKAPAFIPGGPLAGLTFEERVAKISRGKPLRGMPAWKFHLTDEQIREVARYTQTLSGQEPESEPTPSPSGAS